MSYKLKKDLRKIIRMYFNSYLFSMAPPFIQPSSELFIQHEIILKNSTDPADKLTLENLKLFYINKINKLKYKYALKNLSDINYSDSPLWRTVLTHPPTLAFGSSAHANAHRPISASASAPVSGERCVNGGGGELDLYDNFIDLYNNYLFLRSSPYPTLREQGGAESESPWCVRSSMTHQARMRECGVGVPKKAEKEKRKAHLWLARVHDTPQGPKGRGGSDATSNNRKTEIRSRVLVTQDLMADLKFDFFLIHTKKLELYNNILFNAASYTSRAVNEGLEGATAVLGYSPTLHDQDQNKNVGSLSYGTSVAVQSEGDNTNSISLSPSANAHQPNVTHKISKPCSGRDETDRLIISNLLLQKLILSKFFKAP